MSRRKKGSTAIVLDGPGGDMHIENSIVRGFHTAIEVRDGAMVTGRNNEFTAPEKPPPTEDAPARRRGGGRVWALGSWRKE